MIYIVSDTHFGHQKSADIRGFKSTKDMDNYIIDTWNSVITPSDTVYHLGDIAFSNVDDYLSKLNGKKILIRGNHDSIKSSPHLEAIYDMLYLRYNKRKLVLCHYPMECWKNQEYGSIHLHGHLHGDEHRGLTKVIHRRIDISNNYIPFSLDFILENNEL